LIQVTDTGRVEAFSDGVFAIVVTLLVLDLKEPEHSPGELLDSLARQWPAYLGYFASFLFVAVIWLNHHQAFAGIRRVDKGVQIANLTLLLTTALIPFPTAVLSRTFITGVDSTDARTAVALYGYCFTTRFIAVAAVSSKAVSTRKRLAPTESER
jgi:uncharacterized membrane protein